jgi:cytochrome P450
MDIRREAQHRPIWDSDAVDSPVCPHGEAPYYDEALGAWILSRYSDVLAAFLSTDLFPTGPHSKKSSEPPDNDAWLKTRAETLDALSPERLGEWRDHIAPLARKLVDSIPTDRPVDLLREFAQPLCLELAIVATGVTHKDTEHIQELARDVSASAAEPYDPSLRSHASAANKELRCYFPSGPESLRDSGFVALAYTLPCLLANAWFALLQHPEEWTRLHQQPDLLPQAFEELLRYAGLTQILFRRAIQDINLNGVTIKKGDRLILRLIAANKDLERFPQPDQLDLTRRGVGHFTLGAGPHSCVGASLIRMAALVITSPLLERFVSANLVKPIQWQGGSGFRSPVSLPALLKGTRS